MQCYSSLISDRSVNNRRNKDMIDIAETLRKADGEMSIKLSVKNAIFACMKVSIQLKMQLLVWNTMSETVHQFGVHSLIQYFHIDLDHRIPCQMWYNIWNYLLVSLQWKEENFASSKRLWINPRYLQIKGTDYNNE